jgi:hypothetical protein
MPKVPLGTTFTYQGRLESGGEPVNDSCDLAFRLYEGATGDNPVSIPFTHTVPVSDGLFTVGLDFGLDAEGSPFAGDARWLGIQVMCPGDTGFADLGRQELTAVPYALHAMGAPWGGISDLPVGFADGVDDVVAVVSGTNIFAGDGLTQLGSGNSITMAVYFGGSGGDYGAAISVARSDHTHDGQQFSIWRLGCPST